MVDIKNISLQIIISSEQVEADLLQVDLLLELNEPYS